MDTQPPQNDLDARMTRGMEMLHNGKTITENEDGSFSVPSQTSTNKFYEIMLFGSERFVCNCPDFQYRKIEACKHIHAVKLHISANTYLKNEPKPKVLADDAIACKRCGSIRIVKNGFDCGKQTYHCKDCKARFVQDSLLKKAKFNEELVCLTLDLYFSGLSLRKIVRSVSDRFNVDINYSTIYTWIQKYIPVISDYVNTLTPQLSDQWHTDELFVRMKGSQHQGRYKGLAFLWNVMDKETRFLLASKVSENRDSNGAIAALQQAIKNANGNSPNSINTDAHRSYREAVQKTFPNVDHIAKCGVNKPHANNNRIERLNGTLRERVKFQRGWKSKKSQIAEGQRIHYNFVKPHMALKGETPAKKAGLEVTNEKNKWMELLNHAVNSDIVVSKS
ncbi:MAG: DDE-type integrase/transposase/recombinase [Ignavibacteriales bacterium]